MAKDRILASFMSFGLHQCPMEWTNLMKDDKQKNCDHDGRILVPDWQWQTFTALLLIGRKIQESSPSRLKQGSTGSHAVVTVNGPGRRKSPFFAQAVKDIGVCASETQWKLMAPMGCSV
jgi:hypothetical protein